MGRARRRRAATNLAAALSGMRFRVRPGRYALVGYSPPLAEGSGEFLPPLAGEFAQVVSEPGSVTLLVPERRLPRGFRTGRGCRVRRGFRVISFESAMEWTVVGFLARVAGALAEAKVPIGVVCSFDFDHLFVPERRLAAARRAVAKALRDDRAS